MNQKVMFKWLAMFLAVVLCAGVVSCKDDDDDKDGEMSSSLVGTWKVQDSPYTESITFSSDGTGFYRVGEYKETFTWVLKDGSVILDYGDGELEKYINVSVTSTKLTWTYVDEDGEVEEEVYIKQQ